MQTSHSQQPATAITSTLNSQFLEWLISSRLRDVRAFIIIAACCAVIFIPLDSYALPGDQSEGLFRARLVYLAGLLLLLGGTFINPWPRAFALIYTLLFASAGIVFIAELDNTAPALFYKTAAMSYCALFIQASPILTTIYSLPTMCFLSICFHVNTYSLQNLHGATASIFVWTIVLILGVSSYMRDKRNLAIYDNSEKLKKSDLEKKNWLFYIGRLLRHEISNQMVALHSSVALYAETNSGSENQLDNTSERTADEARINRIKDNIHRHSLLLNQLSRASELSDFEADDMQTIDLNSLVMETGQSCSSRQSSHKLVFDSDSFEQEQLCTVNLLSVRIALELLFDSIFQLAEQSPDNHPVFIEANESGLLISVAAANAYEGDSDEEQIQIHMDTLLRSFPWKCAVEVLGAQRLDLSIEYKEGCFIIKMHLMDTD